MYSYTGLCDVLMYRKPRLVDNMGDWIESSVNLQTVNNICRG